MNLYYSKYAFGTKEGVSLKDKIAVVDKYYKEHGITPLFSTIVKKDTNLIFYYKKISSKDYTFNTSYSIIKDLYRKGIYSKSEYLFMTDFYDSIQSYLSNPTVVLKKINNFEMKLESRSNFSSAEINQLESVMAIAKSSVQYWAYGNGHFKAGLSTEDEIPNWVYWDLTGAGTAVTAGYASYAYMMTGFNPAAFWVAVLGMAAISSMI